MKFNLSVIVSITALSISVATIFLTDRSPKIRYVRSYELVYGYLGMQEAQRELEEKSRVWKANIDTLQQDYRLSLGNYTANAASLSANEKTEQEKLLMQQQQNLLSYSQAMDAKAKEEDEKVTEGVLNQINSFVMEYGKENGYEIILGTTLSGSLLYGDETIDITEEVLDALNRNYKGETITNEN